MDQDKSRKVFVEFGNMEVLGKFKGCFNRKGSETRLEGV